MPIKPHPRQIRNLPSADVDAPLASALVVIACRHFGAAMTALHCQKGRTATPRELAAHCGVTIHDAPQLARGRRASLVSACVSTKTPSIEVSAGAGIDLAIADGLALLFVCWPMPAHHLIAPFTNETITAARTDMRRRMMELWSDLDAPSGAVVLRFPTRSSSADRAVS